MKTLSKLLFLYRLKGNSNPYELLKKYNKKNTIDKGRILVVPYRVNSVSNLFEANVSLLLQNRGFEVDALLCGGAVNYCDNLDVTNKSWLRCQLCKHEQEEFSDAFKVNPMWINNLINRDELNEISQFAKNLDYSDERTFVFRNVEFKRPLLSALQLYFKVATIDTNTYRKTYIGFTETICKTIVALDKYFSSNKVEFVLLSHGVYSTWGTVQEYCQTRNIKFVTWGREYNGAGIIAAHNDSYLNEPLYELNSIWDAAPLNDKQRQMVVSYLEAKIGMRANTSDYVQYHGSTKRILQAEIIKNILNIKDEVVIGLFPNIPWDGQTFRPKKIFDNMNVWIFETIEFFRNKPNTKLIIRSHPAESSCGSLSETMAQAVKDHFGDRLPSNVVILPPNSEVSSLSIASISNGCLLYGSTVGYETMFIRKPTIVASDFFYSNKDITFDPINKQEYYDYIEKAISCSLTVDDERFERLLQYTYHYQFRRIMPEKSMELKGLYFSDVMHKTPEAFYKEPTLNMFIDRCLDGDKFYFDEFYN